MRRFSFISLLLVCVLFWSQSRALGWHQPGHMMTALIAYDQLDDATQKKLIAILEKHPRFADDFKPPPNITAEERDRWMIAQASIWPDLVRDHFHDGKIPADPTNKRSYHRKNWHFINRPIVLVPKHSPTSLADSIRSSAEANLNLKTDAPTTESLDFNVIEAIEYNSHVLKTSPDDAARAVALCWLLHLTGDIHQPLHSTALFSETMFKPGPDHDHREGDQGGNKILLDSADGGNLHSLWDAAPDGGKDNSNFHHVADEVDDLVNDPALVTAGQTAANETSLSKWADESFDLASKSVYTSSIRRQILAAEKLGSDPDNDKFITLSSKYESNAQKIAERRVMEGGYRLAARIKASLP